MTLRTDGPNGPKKRAIVTTETLQGHKNTHKLNRNETVPVGQNPDATNGPDLYSNFIDYTPNPELNAKREQEYADKKKADAEAQSKWMAEHKGPTISSKPLHIGKEEAAGIAANTITLGLTSCTTREQFEFELHAKEQDTTLHSIDSFYYELWDTIPGPIINPTPSEPPINDGVKPVDLYDDVIGDTTSTNNQGSDDVPTIQQLLNGFNDKIKTRYTMHEYDLERDFNANKSRRNRTVYDGTYKIAGANEYKFESALTRTTFKGQEAILEEMNYTDKSHPDYVLSQKGDKVFLPEKIYHIKGNNYDGRTDMYLYGANGQFLEKRCIIIENGKTNTYWSSDENAKLPEEAQGKENVKRKLTVIPNNQLEDLPNPDGP